MREIWTAVDLTVSFLLHKLYSVNFIVITTIETLTSWIENKHFVAHHYMYIIMHSKEFLNQSKKKIDGHFFLNYS